MQINLNPTSERGASRDAVNRPRETLGDSHLISSDPRSRFGLVCDLLCCRGNKALVVPVVLHHERRVDFGTAPVSVWIIQKDDITALHGFRS